MDSGCLEPGESLEDNFDMNRDFLPEELIWLMDELLNREVCDMIRIDSVAHNISGRMADGVSAISNTLHVHSH